MPLRISLPVALLLSLFLHAATLAPAFLRAPQTSAPPVPPRLEVELALEHSAPPPEESAPSLDTQATEPPAAPALPTPVMTRGRQLQRAQGALARHLLYPPEAIAQGLEGEVVLLLMLDGAGRIIQADIARSSGHAILDQAALAAARQITALPGNPPQTLLPVRFQLD